MTACVVADDGAQPNQNNVLVHCRHDLSKYKRPKTVFFVDALPVTAYGKIDKKTLRRQGP